MLLFKPEHVEPILSGRKTQTRRMWKRRRAVPGSFHWAQTGYGKADTRFARLEILRVWQERLGAISHEDAVAEGYPDAHQYLLAFHRINKIPLDAHKRVAAENAQVWCVEFKVAPAAGGAGQ